MSTHTLTGGESVRRGGLADSQRELAREVQRVSAENARFREAKVEVTDRGQSGVWERGGTLRIVISTQDLMRALEPELRRMIQRMS